MRTIALAILLTTALAAQDKLTITVQRGTLTRTAVVDGASATDAFKALDYLVAQSGAEYTNETDAIRKQLVAWFISQLRITPGTAIKSTWDAEQAARTARETAEAAYLKAATSGAIQ